MRMREMDLKLRTERDEFKDRALASESNFRGLHDDFLALREREKALVAAIEAAIAYCESEAIGTVQQEIADNERMCQTLRDALEYGR